VKDTFVQRYLQHQRSTLQVQYRKIGTIDKLISYRAQLEVGKKFKDIIHHLCVDDWQAESHFQHQNFAQHCYHDIKEKG